MPPLFRRNRAPETTLTVVAEDSTEAFYRYHVYWRGEDPDGQIVRFLFAITDTLNRDEELSWDPSLAVDRERGVYTTKSDSTFFFDSNAGRQVFNIVAIDDFEERDPSPARSFFYVIDNGLPKVHFIIVTTNSTDPRVLPKRRRAWASWNYGGMTVEDPKAKARAERTKRQQEQEGVFVVENEKASFRPVKIGVAGDNYFEVVSRVALGDEIVSGTYQAVRTLKDGDRARIAKVESKKDKKDKGRKLVFDERRGAVVSKRERKPGRVRNASEVGEEEN